MIAGSKWNCYLIIKIISCFTFVNDQQSSLLHPTFCRLPTERIRDSQPLHWRDNQHFFQCKNSVEYCYPKNSSVVLPRFFLPCTQSDTNVGLRSEGTLKMQLRLLITHPWNREIILDYLGWPHVITWALKISRGRQSQSVRYGRSRRDEAEGEDRDISVKRTLSIIAVFEHRGRETRTKEYGCPLKAKNNSQQIDSKGAGIQVLLPQRTEFNQ